MRIDEILAASDEPVFSFEFFPPKSDEGWSNLREALEALVALEQTRLGRRCVTVYSWNGFGFTADWQSRGWRQLQLLGADRRGIRVLADNKTTVLSVPRASWS